MLFSSQHEVYLHKWKLSAPTKRLETFSSFLYWCLDADQPVVLKIYKDHSDEAASARLLSHYDDNGAVRVLQNDDYACLIEQVGDGHELVELTRTGDDAKATQIFCNVVKNLHAAPAVNIDLKPVDDFLQDFDDHLAKDNLKNRDLVQKARNIFAKLSASQGQKLNLHGDLHHYNIMQAKDDTWLAIDPKGLWGEAEYEIGRYLINPLGDDYRDIDLMKRLEIIDTALSYDLQRIKSWAFSQLILAIISSDEQDEFNEHVTNLVAEFEKLC